MPSTEGESPRVGGSSPTTRTLCRTERFGDFLHADVERRLDTPNKRKRQQSGGPGVRSLPPSGEPGTAYKKGYRLRSSGPGYLCVTRRFESESARHSGEPQ